MKMSLLASLCGCVVVCFSLTAYAACVQPPNCEELGFTADASKCEGSFLKCPWDLSKAACQEKEEIEIGSILYGDGTVTKEILSNKTPIGIVFDETNRLAVALTDIREDGTVGSETMQWYTYTTNLNYNIPLLEDCNMRSDSEIDYDSNVTSCAVDGRMNTTAILNCGSSCGTMPAATACNLYQPSGCAKDFCKKTKWFLPSIRDLNNIYQNLSIIEATLTALEHLGAKTFGRRSYWSSNEVDNDSAWSFYESPYHYHKNHTYKTNRVTNRVRPVIQY